MEAYIKLFDQGDISLFVGDSIQEPSEIQFLDKICSDFTKMGQGAVIFANFFAGKTKQQIDFLIISSNCISVVELKNFNLPVFGNIDGAWELRNFDGSLVKVLTGRNPYHQAREAKYAISDDMHIFSNKNSDRSSLPEKKKYFNMIESVVCIFPEIPNGSKITKGDYKTYVMGYPDFLQFLLTNTTNPKWTRENWIKFSMELGLKKENILYATQPEKRTAIDRLEEYITRFLDFYGRKLPKLVYTSLTVDKKSGTFDTLQELLETGRHFQILGPSGSGKSHHIKHFAIKSIPEDYIPIFIPAKYYSGRFSDLLDRSIAHLYSYNAIQLLNDIAKAGKKPYIIIDGINECSVDQYPNLIENIQAFVLRKRYPIIITSQILIDLPIELKGSIIQMESLTLEEKNILATAYLKDSKAQTHMENILDTLKTPFEISVAAYCVMELGDNFTKYELLNLFSRECLGKNEVGSLGFRLLVKIAKILEERLSAILPMSEFNRIAELYIESRDSKANVIEFVLRSKLVQVSQGYFTFSHEMIQRFFEAEAIISAHDSVDTLAKAMEQPRYSHLAEFVLGAARDHNNVKKLFQLSAFYPFLYGAILGQFGANVCSHLIKDVEAFFQKTDVELKNIQIEIFPEKEVLVRSLMINGINWSDYESALMGVLSKAFFNGLFVDVILNLIIDTEKACFNNLRLKGLSEKTISKLNNELFARLYVWSYPGSLAISCIYQGLRFHFREKLSPELKRFVDEVLAAPDQLPMGYLGLACELIKVETPLFLEKLPDLLTKCWKTNIYNLRLDALQVVGWANQNVHGRLREEIIETINNLDYGGNVFLSTQLIETLSAYNAIEIGITVNDASNEIFKLLNPTPEYERELRDLQAISKEWDDTHNPSLSDKIHEKEPAEVYNSFAYNIYSKIFEDVYQGIYDEAIEKLEKDDITKFLIMAALGAPNYAFFISTILDRLLELDDPRTLPAFEKWAEIPAPTVPDRNEAVESFLTAIIGLSRFTDSPPLLKRPQRDDEAAWQCYREIFFWLHKPLLNDEIIRQKCSSLLQRLSKGLIYSSIDPLMYIHKAIRQGFSVKQNHNKDLILFFQAELRDILIAGLEAKTELKSLFEFAGNERFKKERDQFIVGLLEEIGDENSINHLEKYLENPDLGKMVIDAIKSIRKRIRA